VELRDYIRIIRKNWILIVAVALLGVLGAGAASLLTPPTYTSSTSLFVSIQRTSSDTAQDISTGGTYVQNQIKSYAQTATSPLVLQPVIDQLKLSETAATLAKRVTATAPLDTVVLEIAATDQSPQQAARIVNAVGKNLIAAVDDLEKPSNSSTSPVKISTIQPGVEPTAASSPNVRLNLVLGLILGLALGVLGSILRTVLDTRIHSSRDVELITDATLLGGITFDDEAADRPLVVQVSPQSARAEAFRQLRTNLQFVELTDESRSFVITSSVPSEGKSTTSVNLAITLAEAGSRVLLIDGDLRRPKVAEYMGIEGAVGLTDHLIGRATLEDVLQSWGGGSLDVLPAGQVPPNPSELLGSKAMINLLAKLEKTYDTILIDAPPLLPVTDAAILSKLVKGGAVMVVGAGKIRRAQLEAAIASLETVGGRLVGLILNMIPTKGPDSYGYYGYYGYGTSNTQPITTTQSAD
jgi:capsular exopolysaccharide synthesis family protein